MYEVGIYIQNNSKTEQKAGGLGGILGRLSISWALKL